jgi:aminotransferase EvaB
VDPNTLLMTRQLLERAIGPDTKAVVVTHLYGNVADVASIVELCRPRGIAVIEDCAQAVGARYASGQRVGSLADAAAFSFYPTKNLGAAGDAGAVATNRDEVDARLRSLRQYGWEAKYSITLASGRNSRLDEIQAAVLRTGLPHLDDFNARRRTIASEYARACHSSAIRVVTGGACETVAHLAVLRTPVRKRLRHYLRLKGIETDVHYPVPDHRQLGLNPPARSTSLPVTEVAAAEVVTVPCFPEMTDDEVHRVATAIGEFDGEGA